jgi:uncharacterized phiE125 gp8 family phage protein
METAFSPAELVTKPSVEPLSLLEAKKQLEIAESDSTHDDHVMRLIATAREQFEHDTDSGLCHQTWRVYTPRLYDKMQLPKRPVHSITSITYYDSTNTSTTLSTSVYQLEKQRRRLRLAYDQSWPSTVERWDAFTITYKVGYSVDGRSVPSVAKQAMLLLIGHYFENRDMILAGTVALNLSFSAQRAYEALITRFQRSTYP